MHPKIQDRKILRKTRPTLKGQVVFTNGCFDLLHIGHVRYLQEAKKQGKFLIVALNSDKSVQKLKGKNRPIVPLAERAEMMASLECVDYVTSFNEDTPYKIIEELQPDILVKGGDWNAKDIVGQDIVTKRGGKVLSLSYVENQSTTHIINKIRETC